MKRTFNTAFSVLTFGVLIAVSAPAQQAPAAKPAPKTSTQSTSSESVLKTEKDKESYAVGVSVANTLKRDNIEVDPAFVARGLKDGLAGNKLLLTEDEARAAIENLQKDAIAKQKALAEKDKQEGEAFLAANKSKEGVVTLPDGLQYKVLKQGDGPKPTANDTVECNYRGTLIDGKEFDSSYKHGEPASFPVSRVIKGWTEVLQLMPVGSKYQIFVPSALAYGPKAMGPDIKPNSTLIFEIELLAIKNPPSLSSPAGPAKPGTPAQPAAPAQPATPAAPAQPATPAAPAQPATPAAPAQPTK